MKRLPYMPDPALVARETVAIILGQRRLSEGHAECAAAEDPGSPMIAADLAAARRERR